MLPAQGDPLVAIEELATTLERRLEDHVKVYQASNREKDAAIASLHEKLEHVGNELSQITVETAQQREMHLNVLRSTEEKLNKKMKTLSQTIEQSNSENDKQRRFLNKARLDTHTLQVHSTRQAQELRRARILQIDLQQAVEELKPLPSALREIEAEQAKLYELSQHSLTPCNPHLAHQHRTLSDELGDANLQLDANHTIPFQDDANGGCKPTAYTNYTNNNLAWVDQTTEQDSILGLIHLRVISKIKEAMPQIRLHVQILCIEVSRKYQRAFSGASFTRISYYFKQRVDDGHWQLPLLLAGTVLGALLLGRTLRILRADAQHTAQRQYWSPGDGFVIQPL